MLHVLLRLSLVGGLAAAAAPGQIPAHATVLNPNGSAMFSYTPTLVRDGDTVHACGALRGYPELWFMHYARSRDGGRTWPVREVPLAYTREFNGIAVDGDLVVVLVKSHYFGPHTITSTDGGTTWALPVRVSQQSVPHTRYGAQLHVSGTTISVSWREDRPGGNIWFNQSSDGGVTWRAVDEQLDAGLPIGSIIPDTTLLRMFVTGATMTVLWHHWEPTGIEIRSRRSLDGGATWLPIGPAISQGTILSASGEGSTLAFAAITSPGNGAGDVWISTDAGASWNLATGHGLPGPGRIAVHGSTILVVNLFGTISTFEMHGNLSADGGTTWLPAPFVVQRNHKLWGTPVLSETGVFVHAVYPSSYLPSSGALYESQDGGVSWRELPGEAGTGAWLSADSCLVTTHSGYNPEMYAYVAMGHTSLGQGVAGSGGFTPTLAGSRLPSIGRTFTLEVTNAIGGSLALLATSFAPAGSQPLGGGTLHVQPPSVPFWFFTSGSASAAGTGTFALTVMIPPDPALSGLTLVSQAFVADPGAVGGLALTRAIETWIR